MFLFRLCLSFHIITVISWMAGILYLIRLFVYHREETESIVKERFKVMEWRLYRYITLPAMVGAVMLGIALLFMSPGLLAQNWMHLKLGLAALLVLVTFRAGRFVKAFSVTHPHQSSRYFRVYNEIPTLLMIGIVLLVILRPNL